MRGLRCAAATFLAFLISAQLAPAQDQVPVRAGEHTTYSRLVIPAANDLAWELRTFGREAVLMLPTDEIEFTTDRVFDRIPRTRVLSAKTEIVDGDTFLKLRLACDCPVRAKAEAGALILDVSDPDEEETPKVATETQTEDTPLSPPNPTPDQPEETNEETVASTLADRLIAQLNQAAEQGIIDLADPPSETSNAPPPPPVAAIEPTPTPVEDRLQPIDETLDGLEGIAERVQQGLEEVLGESDLGGSVRITIPEELVQPVENKPASRKPKKVAETSEDPNEHCIDDEYLDVAYWADTRPYSVQAAILNAQVFGEFDEPDPDAVLQLARFFIFYGLGTEAKSLLRDLEIDQLQSEILFELANTVEGKPHLPGGILDKAAGCSGAIALWRTAALDRSEKQPLSDIDTLIDLFADLPIQVRRLVGPRLVQSFITRGQKTAAERIFAIIERAAGYHGNEHELKRADLLRLDQQDEAAEQIYWKLVYDSSDVSAQAAEALVNSMLARGADVPANVLSVLDALAFEFRGSQQGKDLLLTLIKAKAGSDEITNAIEISINEIENEPDTASIYYEAIDSILKDASVSRIGADRYLKAIFKNLEVVQSQNISDTTKISIARQIINAGLPNVVGTVFNSIVSPDPTSTQDILAEAAWKLRNPATIIKLNEQSPRNETLAMFASRAHSSLGQHSRAIKALEDYPPTENTSALNWRAGNWSEAEESTQVHIKLLSQFMKNRGKSSKNEIDPSNQQDAISQSIPFEDTISLKYVNDVKTQSATIRNFIKKTITPM